MIVGVPRTTYVLIQSMFNAKLSAYISSVATKELAEAMPRYRNHNYNGNHVFPFEILHYELPKPSDAAPSDARISTD